MNQPRDANWSWWKDGVLYQIYPRSFFDANGDGIGDLEGIRQKLDHLSWLGVDGIWISPCFPSPMADFGYDVSDYVDIDPMFGTLNDLDRLVADAHARGLKVMLDWVPNHSSDQHAWFIESRSSRDNPKRDWYVWRDPAPDGGPPNNWTSVFGGPAWTLDDATGQYYLHSFLREQPDLNWRNPAVESAMYDSLRFWLDRGVDGFRIDVVHRIAKHPEMLDNPPNPRGPHPGEGADYGSQLHVHDEDDPDVHRFLRRIRGVLEEYDDRAMVGEVWVFDPDVVAAYYGAGDELHLAFNFSFVFTDWSAAGFREQIDAAERLIPDAGWPTWVLSNHDVSRTASRYAKDPDVDDARLKIAALMLLTLRGTPWFYYGEEIGLRDVPIPEALWQDPVAHRLGAHLGRDPERTPMQWTSAAHGGFTTGTPWLPVGADAGVRHVEAQRADPTSLLSFVREAVALRRSSPVLRRGGYRSLPSPDDVLLFERSLGEDRAVVALNFAASPQTVTIPKLTNWTRFSTHPPQSRAQTPEVAGGEAEVEITLAADEGVVWIGARE